MKLTWQLNLLISILLVFFEAAYSQNVKCPDTPEKFISDGQEYLLLPKKTKPATVKVIFYPGIDYQLKICPEHPEIIVEITVTDADGTLIYTNADKKFIRFWNFKFQSLMNAVIELKIQSKSEEEPVRLQLGFKTNANLIPNNELKP